MKKAKNNKTLIWILKNKALELRKNYQLPFHLTKLIYSLKGDEKVSYVVVLKELTEQWLRIKGFYKKYPAMEGIAEQYIKDTLKNMGFIGQS